jgi:meso-butanediol dehydrogenase / (S,S)-butanediol dehydrogenase / diacetyl reductase
VSRVIVITGAGAGLGRALARRFAADGETVVLLGRSTEKLQKVVAELGDRALAVGCDVSSPESVRTAFSRIAERHPRIDVLINNAAYYQPFLVAEATDEQILSTVNTNLTGTILCSRAAVPLLGKGGHIINVSSESVGMNFPHLVLYQATKAGVERFTEGLRLELDPKANRVTQVRAGQMMDADKTWDVDPKAAMRFAQAAMAAGLNLRERPISQYLSVTNIFRAVIDLPHDLHAATVMLHARFPHQD